MGAYEVGGDWDEDRKQHNPEKEGSTVCVSSTEKSDQRNPGPLWSGSSTAMYTPVNPEKKFGLRVIFYFSTSALHLIICVWP